MKKLLGCLIGILLVISSLSQSLPDNLLGPITEELVEKDGLVYKVNYQDSLITVYRRTIDVKDEIIATYKLSEEAYKKVVANKQKIIGILEAENKDLRKEKVKGRIKEILLGIGVGVELIIIIILLV